MSIKLRAILYTIGMFVCIFLGSSLIVAIANFLEIDAMLIFIILLVAFFAWTVYELILNKLKIEKHLTKIEKRVKQ